LRRLSRAFPQVHGQTQGTMRMLEEVIAASILQLRRMELSSKIQKFLQVGLLRTFAKFRNS
jgi:hypothetical protein